MSDPVVIAAAVATIAPFVLGSGTGLLKWFIEPQKDFRARIDLLQSILIEKVASMHAELLNHARMIFEDSELRRRGPSKSDPVVDYALAMFPLVPVYSRLEALKRMRELADSILLWTALTTLMVAAVAVLLPFLVLTPVSGLLLWCAVLYGIAAFITQVITIWFVHRGSVKLNHYQNNLRPLRGQVDVPAE